MKTLFINTGDNNIYFLKCDITKYFPSINHDILLSQLQQCGFSSDEMWFMDLVIKSSGDTGIPLGNQTSQWFALLYLNSIDRLIKERLCVAHYVRYMDDFVLLHYDKEFLQYCRTQIEHFCTDKLKLKLNRKTQIGKLKNGLDFLGFSHKLTATGRVVKRIRASARIRTQKYMKTISHCYLNDIINDEYLHIRRAAFRAHMAGTMDAKFTMNRINTLRRIKKLIGVKKNILASPHPSTKGAPTNNLKTPKIMIK